MERTLSTIQLEDPLYRIFEEHLHSGLYDEQPVETFVRDVVDFYYKDLERSGHIPHQMQEVIRVDLVVDVQDMLRAKIYGHYGISDYNKARRQKVS